jgi:hypothetical protein
VPELKKRLKKRHVENLTRLPTKGLATACWAFIVAKSVPSEAASAADPGPLPGSNKKVIHSLRTVFCTPQTEGPAPPIVGNNGSPDDLPSPDSMPQS